MTASQAEAYRAICQRRVVPVWGPPGTGKTHFLASMILGLAAAHARAGRPFRVLVTAFTHAAIENLLRKVRAVQHGAGPRTDRRSPIAKVKALAAATPTPAVDVQSKPAASLAGVAAAPSSRRRSSGRRSMRC